MGRSQSVPPIIFLVGWQDVTPSDSVDAADWIAPRLHPFAKDVGSIVPTGFAAYARIFHPATGPVGHREVEMRWSEVAASSGRVAHPEMQFHAIATPVPGRPHDLAIWTGVPRDGTLSAAQLSALAEILPSYTTTPNVCLMCLWEGYGYNTTAWMTAADTPADLTPRAPVDPSFLARVSGPPRFAELLKRAKRVRLPGRDYLLFKGSVDQAEGWGDGPNLWWPEDHAWCVASEIDFSYTYVGGSMKLIDEILNHGDLEALPATVDQGISYDSDRLNS